MPFSLVNANAVIVAHHFNPTITDQIWLAENRIVDRDEPEGTFAFTDMLVQVETREFHFLIVPDRCQMTPSLQSDRQQELVSQRLGRLVDKLPHTPYRAVGLNFVYHFTPANNDVTAFARAIFFVDDSPLHRLFDVDGARYGGYLSKDAFGCRLKLDVKPVTIPSDPPVELLQFGFNFNLDIVDNHEAVPKIHELLDRWDEAKQEADRIMTASVKGSDQ